MENLSRTEQLEEIKKELANIQYDFASIRDSVNLSNITDEIEDKKTMVSGFPLRIQKLRSENYVFDKDLEKQIIQLKNRWISNEPEIKRAISRETIPLRNDLRQLELQLKQAEIQKNNPIQAKKLLSSIKFSKDNLTDKVNSVTKAIKGLYDSLNSEIQKMDQFLKWLEFSYKELGEACFKLLAHENLIMAVEAVWTKDGKEDKNDPRGNLFLTDQRLIFEQKEEVAAKKVLFVTTERKLIQEELFSIPLLSIDEMKATEQGLFKNKDFLDLKLNSQATHHQIQLHLFGQDSADWLSMINKVNSGDYDKNRTEEVPQEVIDKIKNAPTICPSCGATIKAVVLRGMDQFDCEYCGVVIRL
jgi:hypothetical protein